MGGGALPLAAPRVVGRGGASTRSAAPTRWRRCCGARTRRSIGRIEEGRLVLDVRTLRDEQLERMAAVTATALKL